MYHAVKVFSKSVVNPCNYPVTIFPQNKLFVTENLHAGTQMVGSGSRIFFFHFLWKTDNFMLLMQGQTILGESSSESEEEKKERDKAQGGKKTPSKSTKPVTPQREDKVKSKKQDNSTSPSKKEEKKHDKTEKADIKPKPKFHVNYEFFDPGNHWCRKCNVVSSNVYEVFQHLQKKQHISVSIFDFKLVIMTCLST